MFASMASLSVVPAGREEYPSSPSPSPSFAEIGGGFMGEPLVVPGGLEVSFEYGEEREEDNDRYVWSCFRLPSGLG